MSDHPFNEIVESASATVANGGTIHQKFTCANCGSRQTMEEPNKLYKTGRCEECGHVTDIEAQGCNFVAMIPLTGGGR